jgi:hypothetical protein
LILAADVQVESKKKGEPARPAAGPTKEEFFNFLKRAQAAFHSRLEDASERANWESILGMDKGPAHAPYPKSRPFRPIWSWDRLASMAALVGRTQPTFLSRQGCPRKSTLTCPPSLAGTFTE